MLVFSIGLGFGQLAHYLSEKGVFDKGFIFRSIVLPDVFIDQASPKEMYDVAVMNSSHIRDKVLQILGIKT